MTSTQGIEKTRAAYNLEEVTRARREHLKRFASILCSGFLLFTLLWLVGWFLIDLPDLITNPLRSPISGVLDKSGSYLRQLLDWTTDPPQQDHGITQITLTWTAVTFILGFVADGALQRKFKLPNHVDEDKCPTCVGTQTGIFTGFTSLLLWSQFLFALSIWSALTATVMAIRREQEAFAFGALLIAAVAAIMLWHLTGVETNEGIPATSLEQYRKLNSQKFYLDERDLLGKYQNAKSQLRFEAWAFIALALGVTAFSWLNGSSTFTVLPLTACLFVLYFVFLTFPFSTTQRRIILIVITIGYVAFLCLFIQETVTNIDNLSRRSGAFYPIEMQINVMLLTSVAFAYNVIKIWHTDGGRLWTSCLLNELGFKVQKRRGEKPLTDSSSTDSPLEPQESKVEISVPMNQSFDKDSLDIRYRLPLTDSLITYPSCDITKDELTEGVYFIKVPTGSELELSLTPKSNLRWKGSCWVSREDPKKKIIPVVHGCHLRINYAVIQESDPRQQGNFYW